jgi:hypothetical protein
MADITTGLQVWYKFDDTVTTDSSGHNNTGILTGSPLPTLVPGIIGNALSFTGGNGYVAFSSVANLGLPTVTSEITIACWIKTSHLDTPIVTLRDTTGTPIIDIVLGNNGIGNAGSGILSALVRDNAGAGLVAIIAAKAISDNIWHHIAFTRTSAKLLTLYVDGLVSGTPITDTMTTSITPEVTHSGIGVEVWQGSYFNGLMDDVHIYNRALTATDIAALASPTHVYSDSIAETGIATDTPSSILHTSASLLGLAHAVDAVDATVGIIIAPIYWDSPSIPYSITPLAEYQITQLPLTYPPPMNTSSSPYPITPLAQRYIVQPPLPVIRKR